MLPAALAFGQDDSLRLYIPQPEEIEEAYSAGLIEYIEYQELLEIIDRAELSRADSLFIQSYADLLIGLSSSLDEHPAEVTANTKDFDQTSAGISLTGGALTRNNMSLDDQHDIDRLHRLELQAGDFSVAGHYASTGSGYTKWARREISYRLQNVHGRPFGIEVGNYKTQFGLGLIYGYHGQLLSKDAHRDNVEKLLYPNYGGGNGALVSWGRAGLLVDVDHNEEYRSRFMGLSAPFAIGTMPLAVTSGMGEIEAGGVGIIQRAYFLSLSGQYNLPQPLSFELAAAHWLDNIQIALAGTAKWKSQSSAATITGWHYSEDYPSFFSGGPSSRRSRSLEIEELNFSYSNRRAGETGVRVNSSYRLDPRRKIEAAVLYGNRGYLDNRVEGRLGLTQALSSTYIGRIQIYYRRDDDPSDEKLTERLQGDIKRRAGALESRLALGYRFDRHSGRNNFMIFLENKLANRIGKYYLLCKFDRIEPGQLQNNYMYVALSFEANIATGLTSLIKYSRTYSRDGFDTPGTVRWDLSLTF